MESVKVLIVEDELIVSEEIAEILKQYGYKIIGQADEASEVLNIINKEMPDIILMDIHIKGSIDGIDLAKQVSENYQIPLIFLTAYIDDVHLNRAKATRPAGYLVKPFKAQDIIAAIEIAFSNKNFQNSNVKTYHNAPSIRKEWLIVREADRFTKIFLTDIIFLEAKGSYTLIQLIGKTVIVTENLKHTLEKISDPNFIRVHRSFVVNLHHVDSYASNLIYLKQYQVPISKPFKEHFASAIG